MGSCLSGGLGEPFGRTSGLVSRVLAAQANPLRREPEGLWQVVKAGGPPGVTFIITHSFFRPAQLTRLGAGRYAQLLYCLSSAVVLHWFLVAFVPHDSPVVFRLDDVIPPVVHAFLSLGCLVVAFLALLLNQSTYTLLGVPQALGRPPDRASLEAGMDIITWQGVLMYRLGGAAAFIAFSGLSILPAQVTASDLVVRVVAALYLRQRSKSFRRWVDKIEAVHLFTWILRLALALLALTSGRQAGEGGGGMFALFAIGAVATLMLRWSEKGK